MKTVLLSHVWLDNPLPGYRQGSLCRRLLRFYKHYGNTWPTVILDNGSEPAYCDMVSAHLAIEVVNLQPHLPYKDGTLEYPAVWRTYWYVKELLKEYEKVIFLATDAYICSQRLVDYIEAIDSGWTALWCPKYSFPATEISVIVRGCAAFEKFFAGDCNPDFYNGLCEENTVPLTHVEKGFVGDRYGEDKIPYSGQDYYTQVSDDPTWDDSQFPVLRRIDGKVICK